MDRQQDYATKAGAVEERRNLARGFSMSAAGKTRNKEVESFRSRLFSGIMVIGATLTALGFYMAQRKVTDDAEQNLQEIFQTKLYSMHKLEELRHEALADYCKEL